jgi:CRP-like cAMP-binding protein
LTLTKLSHATAPRSRSASREPAMLVLSEHQDMLGGAPSLFQDLTEAERHYVASQGTRRVLPRGRNLFTQGTPHDGIFLIESGRIRVFYAAPSGREITLAYWYTGNFVGGPEILGSTPHMWSGMASTNSIVMHFPNTILRALVKRIPALAIGLIEGLTFKGRCYSALAQMLGTRSVSERLTQLLLHLAKLYGVRDGEDIVITAGFTHADLAHLVGATRQWVTISLKRLEAKHILSTPRGKIIIHRPDALNDLRDLM